MNRTPSFAARTVRRLAPVGLSLGLMLLAPARTRADALVGYKVQPILKIGDTVNGFASTPDYAFFVGPLNDSGQLVFDIGTDSGTLPEVLLQYQNGQFTTIGSPGMDSPAGKFPANSGYYTPVDMNQLGDIVFVAATPMGAVPFGTFLWDHQTQ
jgi:hypothetical protein